MTEPSLVLDFPANAAAGGAPPGEPAPHDLVLAAWAGTGS